MKTPNSWAEVNSDTFWISETDSNKSRKHHYFTDRRLDRYLLCRKHLNCVTVCPVLVAVGVGLGRIRKCADIDGRGGRATSTSCGRTQCRGPRVERRASRNPLAVVRDVAVRVPAAAVDSLGFAGSRAGGCRGEVAKHDVFRVRSARATGAEGRALDWRAVVDRRGFACKRELLVVCWQRTVCVRRQRGDRPLLHSQNE